MTDDAPRILASSADEVVDYFQHWFTRHPAAPPKLLEAVQYSLMAGGKRLRPALVLETASACAAGKTSASAKKTALACAAAMELIHTFSLVHDDLPAMDNDDLRRGRPTNHKVFGEAMAILAGDAMVTMAFELIATDADAALAPALIRELAVAAGPQGMIGGQVLDLEAERQPNANFSLSDLQRLHRMKTGALLTASCRLGAISAAADDQTLTAVDGFGRHLGLAFQIVDDCLDVTSTAEQMGKTPGKDKAQGKRTYPALMGLEASQREARQQLNAALEAISPLGRRGEGLKALARFVVERKS